MTHSSSTENSTHTVDDIVGGQTRGFINDQDSVQRHLISWYLLQFQFGSLGTDLIRKY